MEEREQIKPPEKTVTMLAPGVEMPPTEDELPYDDGMPMETHRHVLQMFLLIEVLNHYWAEREDGFVGGDMFVYFSPDQVYTHDFRGPDVFVVQGVSKRSRKSWVVWQEGKAPDVVIELLSETTAEKDRNEKKLIYQDRLRVPEYFWYDPYSGELAGFSLRDGKYVAIEPDADGRLVSQQLGLMLRRWEGVYQREEATWLRWATPDGVLLPTPKEQAEQEHQQSLAAQQQAEQAQQQAKEAQRQAEEERQRAAELEALLARYRERLGDLPE